MTGRRRRGISMTETLVASVILAFALVPILTIVSQGSRSVQTTGRALLINALARLVLEDLKTRKYDEITTTIYLPVLDDPSPQSPFNAVMNLSGSASGTVGLSEAHFPQLTQRLRRIFYRITVADDLPETGMKTVGVTFRETLDGRTMDQHFVTILKKE